MHSKPLKPNCDAKGNSFINQVINTTLLDNLVQEQFISIQRNRYRNDKSMFPVNQTPLITNISSIDAANFKQFAETMLNGDDGSSEYKSKSFFIVQIMEYIDKELLYSKAIMKITFSLQSHPDQLKICAKIFGKDAHSGSCDFDAFYLLESARKKKNRIQFFVELDKSNGFFNEFVSVKNKIIANVNSLIHIPQRSKVFIQTEMSNTFNPITLFTFTENALPRNVYKEGSIFIDKALSRNNIQFDKCEMIKEEYAKWCQFCNQNTSSSTSSSCQKENEASLQEGTTLSSKLFIDFKHLDVNNLKALTFHVKGYHGRIYATPLLSNKDLPIFVVDQADSNPGFTQNPLNFFQSKLFVMELNSTKKGALQSNDECLDMKIMILFSNNVTHKCFYHPLPRVYLMANNHNILLGYVEHNHTLWNRLILEGFDKIMNITAEYNSNSNNATEPKNYCQGQKVSSEELIIFLLFPIKTCFLIIVIILFLLIACFDYVIININRPPDLPIRDYGCKNNEEDRHDINERSNILENNEADFVLEAGDDNKVDVTQGSNKTTHPISSFQNLPPNSIMDNSITSNGSLSISYDILRLKTFCGLHQKVIKDIHQI